MITPELKHAIHGYTEKMSRSVTLILNTGEHPKKSELRDFLSQLASSSPRIEMMEQHNAALRGPLSFAVSHDALSTGVQFSGIPGGHEFNSLVLAILHMGGMPTKLDDGIHDVIARVDQSLHFEIFVSLSCHNCPDVVQALQQFAIMNHHITAEMIDGGVHPELIHERNIQGVPAVYLNGEPFANGKIDTAQLLHKLIERLPHLKNTDPITRLPTQDITVIGGGPAGVAAAIYAARKGLAVTIVADRLGGQVKDTQGIENLISVPHTTGPQLVENLKQHMNQYPITIKEHVRVETIEPGSIKNLILSSGEHIQTHTLIIATGAKWRELGIPGERENIGSGVAYCPHCDGPFFAGRDVAVIGGGNSGIEAALDLSGIVKSVTVYEFLPELKADRVLVDQAEKRNNITLLTNVAAQEILADNGKVVALRYQDRATGNQHQHELAGVFVQIGLIPNSQFLDGVVARTPNGEVLINEKCETNTPGIFACGDVSTVPYKQIVIASGEGAKAALSAYEYHRDHV
ncbi:MAG: alkyl hydroperoxide reductase subunit F [Gammaproteobacteria bacterium]